MMPYTDYTVRLGDLKRAIMKNPYDPNLNIDGYMRYLKYNTPSAQPDKEKEMDELVKKADVIDCLRLGKDENIEISRRGIKKYILGVSRKIKQLPTVQSERGQRYMMDDLISRQAVIDAIRASTSKYTGFMEMEMYTDDDAIEAINGVPSAKQWIPCSERLPERGKDVLVTRDYDGRADGIKSCRYVEVASCYGEDGDITWNSFSDEYKMRPRNHHVVAWMPLPEPYREGADE